jgi:hypothetical protein
MGSRRPSRKGSGCRRRTHRNPPEEPRFCRFVLQPLPGVILMAWSNCPRGERHRRRSARSRHIATVAEDLGLDLKEIGLNDSSTTHALQQRCDRQHQLALEAVRAS